MAFQFLVPGAISAGAAVGRKLGVLPLGPQSRFAKKRKAFKPAKASPTPEALTDEQQAFLDAGLMEDYRVHEDGLTQTQRDAIDMGMMEDPRVNADGLTQTQLDAIDMGMMEDPRVREGLTQTQRDAIRGGLMEDPRGSPGIRLLKNFPKRNINAL